MKIKVVGRKQIEYTSNKTGKLVSGDKLFFTFPSRYTEGLETDSCFIPSSQHVNFPLGYPVDAEIYYNKFGSVDELIFN